MPLQLRCEDQERGAADREPSARDQIWECKPSSPAGLREPPENDRTVQRRCGLARALLVVTAAVALSGTSAYAAGSRGPAPAPPLHPVPPTLRLPARIGPLAVNLPILMYHRIDRITSGLPSITRALTVTPGVFRDQMAWIAAHGFHTVTQMQLWNALMHRRRLPTRPFMVTFDDAYRDVVTYAGPIIRRNHQHATAYVITDRLSRGRVTPWMTWRQLRVLQRDGFDIGSHTVSHVDLVATSSAQARFQLRASRFALERFLHLPVQWLAYPYGKVDPAVVALARRAGYVLAVTTQSGTLQRADGSLLLHRNEITDATGVAGLARLLTAGDA
jgi:peptidoglycan/xylan/chitin deacetylase (PgdA/CDA1 family)